MGVDPLVAALVGVGAGGGCAAGGAATSTDDAGGSSAADDGSDDSEAGDDDDEGRAGRAVAIGDDDGTFDVDGRGRSSRVMGGVVEGGVAHATPTGTSRGAGSARCCCPTTTTAKTCRPIAASAARHRLFISGVVRRRTVEE